MPIPVEELLALELFSEDPPEAIAWIAEQMSERTLEAGEEFVSPGEPVNDLIIVLDGETHYGRDNDPYGQIFVRKRAHAAGVLPFSRIKVARGYGRAAVKTRLAMLDAKHLRELVYRAPCLAQKLVSEMTDRTRQTTQFDERANKMLALGKLSAGLAHELNNPAAAVTRSAARLRELLRQRRADALALRTIVIPVEVSDLMGSLGESFADCPAIPALDPLEKADREQDLGDWLEQNSVDSCIASDLVEAGITAQQLAPIIGKVDTTTLELGLRILAADYQILCLTREVEEAAQRISGLVQAVKTYSYMDQTPLSEVDVEAGLDVTLRIFQHRLKRGIQVKRVYAGNLPRLEANGSELNQVWTNLIDNALDAMEAMPPASQVLTVRTCVEGKVLLVEIGDNGPGIPDDIQGRIFEQFFTTKPMGEGTGLGLDIVRRIVVNHKGTIHLESRPGETIFQIRLPLR
jgi:signal transduction histidine kinase